MKSLQSGTSTVTITTTDDASRPMKATSTMIFSYVNTDSGSTNQNTDTMTRQEIEDIKNRLASLILDREAKLKEHDYVSAKIADGRATAEEYADVIASKNRWAEEVNEAMAEIARLDSITPEDEGLNLEEE